MDPRGRKLNFSTGVEKFNQIQFSLRGEKKREERSFYYSKT